MGDMLSQAEIDALLNGTSLDDAGTGDETGGELSPQEIDALGEIGNISMGTSATTLFTLLGQKVVITTPRVIVSNWDEISREYSSSYVAVRVEYTHGLVGSNLLIMKEMDVKVITDLMMGGDGSNTSEPLSDLHLSAISEAMNQMVGSSSTSMSAMFDKRIDISPPKAFILDVGNMQQSTGISGTEPLVKIAFKMIIGTLIDSEIMQILPISFAKKLVDNLLNMDTGSGTFNIPSEAGKQPEPQRQNTVQQQTQQFAPQQQSQQFAPQQHPQQFAQQQNYQQDNGYDTPAVWNSNDQRQAREPVNVQPAHFQNFDDSRMVFERKNISLIMDVPLQVTVELGRTQKLIKDILEFGPGSIIELDKLAGEPVDILVNGKAIAKGEVVVIDESFGVRITDIIHPSKRL